MSGGISAALSMARPPVPAPSGEVALVHSQIADAAALWASEPDEAGAALRLAAALLKRLLVQHDGYEVRTEGGEMLAAFGDPVDAARWCLEAQSALVSADWPARILAHEVACEVQGQSGAVIHRGPRVGMAMDVGEPDVVEDLRSRRTDYRGPMVDSLRRFSASVHGGQVALTAAAWAAVEAGSGTLLDADCLDLGRHRFAGREEPVGVVQILPYVLAERSFPTLRSTLTQRTNLPVDPGFFVGRERLMMAVDRTFQQGRKLVVLKGHGGIGKTRLALRYGGVHLEEYGDGGGVWFCDLQGARSIDGVCHAVARALGVSLRSRSLQATQQLARVLSARGRCLLILDNFEQVAQYAEYTVGVWARKAPRLRILVTSRHRLGIDGEALVEVTPMDSDEAEQLFRQRVSQVRPELELDDEDPVLADIVHQVQCVPLAVELAAAWVGILEPPSILRRLARGHRGLEGVDLEVDPRHTSVRAVMAGSWELLAPHEQEALVSCAVFDGGFTPDAAAAIVDLSRFRDTPPIMEVLRSLTDKSLLYHPVGADADLRLTQYDAIREFAEEKLASMGLRPTLERRHAAYYLKLGAALVTQLRGRQGLEALAQLRVESRNLRAAYRRFLDRDARTPVQAALALDPLLSAHGPFDLHLKILDGALQASLNTRGVNQVPLRMARVEALLARARLQEAADAVEATRALLGAQVEDRVTAWIGALRGWTRSRQGDVAGARDGLEAACNVFDKVKDHPHGPVAALRLGLVLVQAGELEESEKRLLAVQADAARRHDLWLQADVLSALGDLARHRGNHAAGLDHYQRALALAERLSDRPRQSRLLTRLGGLHLDERRNDAAERAFQGARAFAEEVGDTIELAVIDGNLGRMRHHQGQGREAESLYRAALERFDEVGATRWSGIFLGVFAALLHEQGRTSEARDAYKTAHDRLKAAGSRRFAGLVLGRTGALYADEGDSATAERLFIAAEAELRAAHDPHGLAAIEVHRGHVDLARARAGDETSRAAARERFRLATSPPPDPKRPCIAPAAVSNDVRLALRLLRRSMELEARKAG